MGAADGLISVSPGYIGVLQERYPRLQHVPVAVIPFGLHLDDLRIAKKNDQLQQTGVAKPKTFDLIYVGRGGYDLLPAFKQLFAAIKLGLQKDAELFQHLRVKLYGTSYAAAGQGISTLDNEIQAQGLTNIFEESTDRLPYYQALNILRRADLLLLPGSEDAQYSASKIFPYLLAQKPILAIVHQGASATSMLSKLPGAGVFSVGDENPGLYESIKAYLENVMKAKGHPTEIPLPELGEFSSANLTKVQTELFNQVCRH